VVAGTTVEGAVWPLFARSAWAQPATVVADTTGEGAALPSVRLAGVGPANHLWWARQIRALLWLLFDRSAWAQQATVVAGTTGEDAALAYVPLVVMGSASHCGCGHDR
jgi:hypothetical protein